MKSHFTYRCSQPVRETVEAFLTAWDNHTELFEVQTSGSTGKPKTIQLRREQLEASAKRTLHFFNLQPGDTALLALPVQTIAGKMMLVRALVGGLNLIITDPSSQPLECLLPGEQLDFIPLSPLQLQQLNQDQLSRIKCVLLGGTSLSPRLEKKITSMHHNCYIGFGMTETVSHIALRKSGDPFYHALDGIHLTTEQNKLVIDDEKLGINHLTTNDLIELINPTTFKWLGRSDFAINSGGVKIHPEQLEQLIGDFVTGDFFIAGIPDDTFGEKCIMVADTSTVIDDFEEICSLCRQQFGPYSAPKQLYRLPIIYSSGTKINRRLTLEQLTIGE